MQQLPAMLELPGVGQGDDSSDGEGNEFRQAIAHSGWS